MVIVFEGGRSRVRVPIGSKVITLVFDASPLRTEHQEERGKTGWLGIKTVCPSGVTCLSADCCFSELELSKSN
jgi:hypothetical protein